MTHWDEDSITMAVAAARADRQIPHLLEGTDAVRLADKSHGPLEKAVKDPDPGVAQAAMKALKALGG